MFMLAEPPGLTQPCNSPHPARRARPSAARSAPWYSGTLGAASSRAPMTRTWTRSARCASRSSSSGGRKACAGGWVGLGWAILGARGTSRATRFAPRAAQARVGCAGGWVGPVWLGAAPCPRASSGGVCRWLRGVFLALASLGACMHAESMLCRAPMTPQHLPAPASTMDPNKQFLLSRYTPTCSFDTRWAPAILHPAHWSSHLLPAPPPPSRHGPTYGTVREGSRHLFEELARQGVRLALVDCREVLAQHAPAERSVVALEASSDAQVRWVALLRIMVLHFAVGITCRAGGMQAAWEALILGGCSSFGRRPGRSARAGGTVARLMMFSLPCQAAGHAMRAGLVSHHSRLLPAKLLPTLCMLAPLVTTGGGTRLRAAWGGGGRAAGTGVGAAE